MQKPILPGSQLGYSEEFVPGPASFERDGAIIATSIGTKVEDKAARSVGVKAIKPVRRVAPGDVVYGVIEDLMETIAIVRFEAVPDGSTRPVSHTDSAYLRVSEIMPGYVDHIRDYLRVGDILRARVLEVKPLGTYLSLKGREFGVLKAFCSRCRAEMSFDSKSFYCAKCARRESRKIPSE